MTTSRPAYSMDTRIPSLATLPKPSKSREYGESDILLLSRVAARISSGRPLSDVLSDVIEFVTEVVKCDSCTVYVAEGEDLVSRSAQNSDPSAETRVKVKSVIGATGWAAGNEEAVALIHDAHRDPRAVVFFNDSIASPFEALLSVPMMSHGRLVGVINLQSRSEQAYEQRGIALVATVGFLAGVEIERSRLDSENLQLTERLVSRKIVERAKGILQRDLHLSEEDAYLTLQRESRQRRKSMKDVAEAIILSDDLKKKK